MLTQATLPRFGGAFFFAAEAGRFCERGRAGLQQSRGQRMAGRRPGFWPKL